MTREETTRDDADLLLGVGFLRKTLFESGELSTVPRPLVVLAVVDNMLRVLEQGYLMANVHQETRADFFKDTMPDFGRTRAGSVAEIQKTVNLWLACTQEARDTLRQLGREDKRLAKRLVNAKPVRAVDGVKPTVWIDAQRRTCLRAAQPHKTGEVQFIPMEVGEGFDLERLPEQAFGERYMPLADYPVERAAALYVSYALVSGASEAAMQVLGSITKVTPKEIDMATQKKAASAAKKSPAAKKVEKAPKAAKAAAKGKAAAKTNGSAPARTPRGETAAAMFQALIREGKKTDAQIFEAVKAKFGLDDKKRGYVAWYRNYLSKKGEKVPGPVSAAA